jgi:hypothetical protein
MISPKTSSRGTAGLFRAGAVWLLLPLLACTPPGRAPSGAAETWHEEGFAAFSRGRFEDSGSNAYVSARGRVQLINRLDLDGDGHLDIFIGNGHSLTENEDAYLYLSNGREPDPLRRVALPTNSAVAGLVADFDKDGRNDLVVVNTHGGITSRTSTYVYYGAPGGFPLERRRALQAWRGGSAAAADFDGDGWLDLAIACANPASAGGAEPASAIYWNGPSGFDERRRTELPGAGLFALAADLDGDGAIDLAVARKADVAVYRRAGGKLDIGHPRLLPLAATHLAAADLDRDGVAELVAVTAGGIDILAATRQGPSAAGRARIELANAVATAAADFDHDGWIDLAATRSNQSGNEYTDSFVFRNEKGRFSPSRAAALPTVSARGVSAGDLDGDGWADLVISNYNSFDNLDIQSFVYWNDRGAFSLGRKSMLDTKAAQGNCIGDLDNDGHPDVVFFNFEGGLRGGDNPNHIYWGDGTRNYSTARRTSLWSVYTVGTIQADLDDDGRVDLGSVEARYAFERPDTLHGVYVWYGAPEGYSESRRAVLSVENPEFGGVTADLDRDGYLDLVIGALEHGAGGRTGPVVLYGGPHGFSPTRREVVPTGLWTVPIIADFDRDGRLDLLSNTVEGEDNRLQIAHGAATGFAPPTPVASLGELKALYLEVADFDRDGWLDLVVPTALEHKEGDIRIYYGSPAGFRERGPRLPHLGGLDPAVADLNKDGHLDLFVPNYTSEYHRKIPSYLYWGSARGFSPENRLELPGDAASAALPADFDGDSWLDLLVINHKREGDRDRAGHPIDHKASAFLFWNSPRGFDPARRTELPTLGPHGQMLRDPGNIYTRELAEVYVSAPHAPRDPALRAVRIDWRAETPFGTSVHFQVRGAASAEAIERAEWRGPSGAGSWFTRPGSIPTTALAAGPWLQYRARLATPDGGSSPVLTAVTIELR